MKVALPKSSKTKTEILEIVRILNRSFPNPVSVLKHRNSFELLIAVILSAQCTDLRVNKTTPSLFPAQRACTAQDILDLGEETVKNIIRPYGYFNHKTKAIMGCAHALLNKEVPSDFDELIALPGVGAKTAQVIQAQWFKKDAFPVDTHIHRVANRLGLANTGNNRDKTELTLKAQMPQKDWSRLHLQMVFHGRETCKALKPRCAACPLKHLCKYYKTVFSVSASKAKPAKLKRQAAKDKSPRK